MGCNRVFYRVLPGQPAGSAKSLGFFLPLFFLQPGPVPAPGRLGPGQPQAGPGFKTMVYPWFFFFYFSKTIFPYHGFTSIFSMVSLLCL